MSYRQEIQALIDDLRSHGERVQDAELRELCRRRAEILDFLINHPQDAIANLDS
jgi:hypothetical protein